MVSVLASLVACGGCSSGGSKTGKAVLAAAGGAAVGGATVATGYYLNGLADSYKSSKHKAQSEVISELVRRHLAAQDVPLPSGFDLQELRMTHVGLGTTAPIFPPMKLAFDAICRYQTKRKKTVGCIRTHAGTSSFDEDPRTVVCEFLKFWIREKILDRDIEAYEVMAYRDFCRGILNYPDVFKMSNTMSFCKAMAYVASNLDEVLKLRLRQMRSATHLFERLHGEAYHFALHAVKIPLLVATDIDPPNIQYSMESLTLLRRTALPANLLASEFHRNLAKKMEAAWQTECGCLIRLLLSTPHMERLCAAREGALPPEEATVPFMVVVQRAENLPDVQVLGVLDPYVKVKVTRDGEKLCKAKTTVKVERHNPKWRERLFVEMPANDEEAELGFEVSDYRKSTGGRGNTHFAHSAPMRLGLVRALAHEGSDVRLSLEPSGGLARERLLGSAVVVRFEEPRFDREIKTLRRRWRDDEDAAEVPRSGLRLPEVGPWFLAAVESLENLVYFLDIVFSQCAELSRLLGDLGIVLIAPMLTPLLDEVDQRVGAAADATAKVLDVVYSTLADRAKVGKRERTGCTSNASVCHADDRRQADKSLISLKDLKNKVIATSTELRRVCVRYGGVEELLAEASENAKSLLRRLHDDETSRRSSRFAGVLCDVVSGRRGIERPGFSLSALQDGGGSTEGDEESDSE